MREVKAVEQRLIEGFSLASFRPDPSPANALEVED
jgi:hypothetical protein